MDDDDFRKVDPDQVNIKTITVGEAQQLLQEKDSDMLIIADFGQTEEGQYYHYLISVGSSEENSQSADLIRKEFENTLRQLSE